MNMYGFCELSQTFPQQDIRHILTFQDFRKKEEKEIVIQVYSICLVGFSFLIKMTPKINLLIQGVLKNDATVF